MADDALLARIDALERMVINMGETIGVLHANLARTEAFSHSLVVAQKDTESLLEAHASMSQWAGDTLLFTTYSDYSIDEAENLRAQDRLALIELIQRGDELRAKAQPPSDPGPPQQCGQP